jgi:hypothetical protein
MSFRRAGVVARPIVARCNARQRLLAWLLQAPAGARYALSETEARSAQVREWSSAGRVRLERTPEGATVLVVQ